MIKRWEVEIPALTGSKKRKAYIYLPAGYGTDNEKRYPVMYMFDGHNLFYDKEASFGKSWGLKDYLDKTKAQIIIAAVECNHDGIQRLSEYSPVNFSYEKVGDITGRGRKYMNWLVKSFKPYIDENFRTLPDRKNTAIGGSSMGGLMTLYALASYNRYFSRGAALSPSIWVCGGVPDFILKSRFGKETLLYMDYGSKELKNHDIQQQVFSKTCEELINKNVLITSRIVPGGTHSEASWEKQIPYFMSVLGFRNEK